MHREQLCERPLFELELDTPAANVTGLDFEHRVATGHGERTGAKIALGTGSRPQLSTSSASAARGASISS